MNLSKSLKVALAMSGMKQKELAEKMGMAPQQISNWAASGSISRRNQDRLCEVLGIKLSEFVALGESEK